MKHQWREKDGCLIHDGDCRFWGNNICTCGLLHFVTHLIYSQEPPSRDLSLYPTYYEDSGAQEHVFDHLRRNEPPKVIPPTQEECDAMLRWLEEKFGSDAIGFDPH